MASETSVLGAVSYDYDTGGRRTALNWPDGFRVEYDWDVTGAVAAMDEVDTVTLTSTRLLTFDYDTRGRRSALWRGPAASPVAGTSYAYDALSRLHSFSVDVDGSGTTNDLTRTFIRNTVGQITGRGHTNAQYAFDVPQNASSLAYGANGLNQITWVGGSAPYGYDDRGNLTSDGASDYGYDLENRLTSVNVTRTLDYDPLGRL